MIPGSLLALAALVSTPVAHGVQDDAARLVPADATLLVRLDSLQGWNELVRTFAVADDALASYDLQRVLNQFQSGGGKAAEPQSPLPVLDPARPLYLALAFPAGATPAGTLVAPVT